MNQNDVYFTYEILPIVEQWDHPNKSIMFGYKQWLQERRLRQVWDTLSTACTEGLYWAADWLNVDRGECTAEYELWLANDSSDQLKVYMAARRKLQHALEDAFIVRIKEQRSK